MYLDILHADNSKAAANVVATVWVIVEPVVSILHHILLHPGASIFVICSLFFLLAIFSLMMDPLFLIVSMGLTLVNFSILWVEEDLFILAILVHAMFNIMVILACLVIMISGRHGVFLRCPCMPLYLLYGPKQKKLMFDLKHF